MAMSLLTYDAAAMLRANGLLQRTVKGTRREMDFHPVVKLHVPGTGAVWLLTEIDPDEPDIAFGLADLGMGFPELGSVSLGELEAVGKNLGFAVEADHTFVADRPLSEYAREARQLGRISA